MNFTKYSITIKNESKRNSFRQILNKVNQIKKSKKKEKNHAFSMNFDKSKRLKGKQRKLLKEITNLKNILNEYKN